MPTVPSPVFGSVGPVAAVAAGAGAAAGRVICSPCTCTGFVDGSGGTSSVGTSTVVGGGPSVTVNPSGSKS